VNCDSHSLQDFRKFLADAEVIDGVHLKQANVASFFTSNATTEKEAMMDPYQVLTAATFQSGKVSRPSC
jgi:hypothetical protein